MGAEKELKDQRIPIMMAESELAAVDDWSFKHRIRSRGESIRRLCQMGLAIDEHSLALFEQAKQGLQAYKDRSDELTALFSDPHRPAQEVATSAAQIMPELLQQLKSVSLLSSQIALAVLPYSVAPNFHDAHELSELLKEAATLSSDKQG